MHLSDWKYGYVLEHHDKMADTSADNKQMKDLVRTEILMSVVEDWKLQGIDDTAHCIDNTTCKQPVKCSLWKCVDNLSKC